MREEARIKRMLNKLEKIWLEHPDMRLGQLLINLCIFEDSFWNWNNEDDNIEKALDYNCLNPKHDKEEKK